MFAGKMVHFENILLWIWTSKHCKVSEQSLAEGRDAGCGRGVDSRHVGDIFNVSPGLGACVLESSVIYMLADQLHSSLIMMIINLEERKIQ